MSRDFYPSYQLFSELANGARYLPASSAGAYCVGFSCTTCDPDHEACGTACASNVECGGPAVNLTANPQTIYRGQSSTLTWSSVNTSSCSGSNFNTGGATQGSVGVWPTSDTIYGVTCSGPGGSASASVTVRVIPPPTCTANFSPNRSISGTNVLLSWSSSYDSDGVLPYSCTGNLGSGNVSPDVGSVVMTPTVSQTCTLTVSNPAGTNTCNASITVFPPITGSCSVSPTSGIPGDPFKWSAAASGGDGVYTYQWNLPGAVNPTPDLFSNPVRVNYDTAGIYDGSVTISSVNSSQTFTCSNRVVIWGPMAVPPRFREVPPEGSQRVITPEESGGGGF
ncbi:MAG: hypothetical protein QXI71_06705 [Candidatus Bathyarchaeia archaeon]